MDAQDVINRQIADDYDIFLGILWARLGSGTGRYSSGTVEEYYRAKERKESGCDPVEIMIYFKDEPISPSKIDAEQLKMVSEFRKKISLEGVYYREFSGISEFERLVRVHLTRKISDYNLSDRNSSGKAAAVNTLLPQDDEDEVGLFELFEKFEKLSPRMEAVLSQIAQNAEWLTERLNFHTEESKRLISNVFSPPSREDFAAAIKNTSIDMDQFSDKNEKVIPDFDSVLNESAKLVSDMIAIYKERADAASPDVVEFFEGVDSLRKTINESLAGVDELSTTIGSLPRLTSALNSAKKRAVKSLGLIASRMRQVDKMIAEVA